MRAPPLTECSDVATKMQSKNAGFHPEQALLSDSDLREDKSVCVTNNCNTDPHHSTDHKHISFTQWNFSQLLITGSSVHDLGGIAILCGTLRLGEYCSEKLFLQKTNTRRDFFRSYSSAGQPRGVTTPL